MISSVPPRLHVLLARNSKMAVVIRRGPSRRTAVVGWNRATDTFELGQWLYGRLYERRADLSPDGKHLIYFAMNGRWDSKVKGAWSAISRAPYLKAISLYPKGDCWHGGGLFLSAKTYWLNDGLGHDVVEEDRRLKRVLGNPWHESYGGECHGVYFIRLQRDGWRMKGEADDGRGGAFCAFEKPINAQWTLRKLAHASINDQAGRGVYFDTHELVNVRTGETLSKEEWEWADVDGSRLMWACAGRLFAGRVKSAGLSSETELHDFTTMRYERLAAPY